MRKLSIKQISSVALVYTCHLGACCIFYPEVIRDNVVSNDVTITPALRSALIIFGKNTNFLVK